MIRSTLRFAPAALLAAMTVSATLVCAQQQVPPAPPQEPSAPAPSSAPTFPKPDPARFTATSPSKDLVNAFLQASWGYDDSRIWQVQAIMKTTVEGISKVIVVVADKTGKQKPAALQFLALADGKHIIADNEIIAFGEHPFAENRAILQQRADGPYRGSAVKDLELVEFADFQCPHCKEAQATMEKLAVDFPKARIVFQNYPLPQHAAARNAAAYGACVAKLGGNDAFFGFASTVFDGQDGLATPDGATLTLNSAVTKAGLDPAKVSACVATQATNDGIDASIKLAQDLNINQTPMLLVNGRMVPIGGAPYATVKQVIDYQAKLDGVAK